MMRVKRIALLVLFIVAGLLVIKVPLALTEDALASLRAQGNRALLEGLRIGVQALTAALMLVLTWLFTVRVDRLSLADVWLFWGNKSLRLLFFGAAIMMLAGGLACGIYFWTDSPAYLQHEVGVASTLMTLFVALVAGFFQAAGEELWCRSWSLKFIVDLTSERTAALTVGALLRGGSLVQPGLFHRCGRERGGRRRHDVLRGIPHPLHLDVGGPPPGMELHRLGCHLQWFVGHCDA